jgi:hypothetical protein
MLHVHVNGVSVSVNFILALFFMDNDYDSIIENFSINISAYFSHQEAALTSLGTVTLGLAFERVGLHKRVCFRTLQLFGVKPHR